MKSVATGRPRLQFVLLWLGAIVGVVAQAREGNTYEDELRIYAADLELQCKSVKQQLESFRLRSDPLTGYNLKDAVESLCHCLPQKTQAFKSTLSAEELARPVSAEDAIAAIAAAASDYLPRAADAEKNGQPVPERPPTLEMYFQADQRCKR